MSLAAAKRSARLVSRTAARIGARSVLAIQNRLSLKRRVGFLDALYRAFSVLPAGTAKYSAMRFLAIQEYGTPVLTDLSDQTIFRVRNAAEAIYGDEWNSFSDALRPEVLRCFNGSIEHLRRDFKQIDYLEIGSAQGLSMAYIGTTLSQAGLAGTLTSIDPYIDAGYIDSGYHVRIGKDTREKATQLYASLGLPISIMERPSGDALVELLRTGRKFHLIYIDGLQFGADADAGFRTVISSARRSRSRDAG
jgi:hypothetical protein